MIRRLVKEDVPALVKIHEECFPKETLTQLGSTFLRALYCGFVRLPQIHAWGIFEKNQLVGFVVGSETADYMKHILKNQSIQIITSLLSSLVRISLVKKMAETLFYSKKSSTTPAELVIIGVTSQYRHKGLGKKLLTQLTKSFMQKKITRFHVCVYASKNIANRFYKKFKGILSGSFVMYNRKWNIYDFDFSSFPRGYTSIILPTYNESGNIKSLLYTINSLRRQYRLNIEIIVVDDNSPDGTYLIAQKIAKSMRNVHVFVRKKDHGLAKSIITGIQKARGKFILVMDTDFNHDPQVIPILIKRIQYNDMIIGSRFIKGGGMENKIRNLLSSFFNIYLRFLLTSPIHDHLSGFFITHAKYVKNVTMKKMFYGFGDYFIRLIFYMQKRGMQLEEVPVYYKDRTSGVSKSKFVPMFFSYTISAIKLRFNLQ